MSKKTAEREILSDQQSSGDRRTGSVGERPELAGSRDSGNRQGPQHKSKSADRSIASELEGGTENDPGLGG